MNFKVLVALKNMIIEKYPGYNVNWEAITYSIEKTFLYRDAKFKIRYLKTGCDDIEYDNYTRG
jgi:hypothetical protein